MAERERFELSREFLPCTLSKGVPSTTRPSLRRDVFELGRTNRLQSSGVSKELQLRKVALAHYNSSMALFLLTLLNLTADASCLYTVDANSIQINWTAFKTTQKVAVTGSFSEVTLSGELRKVTSFDSFLSQLEGEIDVNAPAKIRTGNVGRDQTLFEKFFALFKKSPIIHGAIHEVKGTESSGEFKLGLSMNEHSLRVPMTYTREEKGGFLGRGVIDLNEFGLSLPLASLHQACEQLHKGPDGISKTWPTVEIRLMATIEKKCTP